MLVKLHAGIRVGNYIRPHGHNVTTDQKWWKVVDIDGDTLHTVDRHGTRRDFGHRPGRKWKTWEPGDPRADGDNL